MEAKIRLTERKFLFPRYAVGFAISPDSHHAVFTVQGAERNTPLSFYQFSELVRNLILLAIQNPSSPEWFPELTEDLGSYGWQQLYEKYGLQAINYSTDKPDYVVYRSCSETGTSINLKHQYYRSFDAG